MNERIARDGLQPKLDLTALGGATGPGLNQVGTGSALGLPATPYPGIDETLRQVVAFDFPSYGFSLQMTFPFRNSTAKANLAWPGPQYEFESAGCAFYGNLKSL